MFGKTKTPTLPSHQVVANLACDALLGTLSLDIATGYSLVATFKKYNADSDAQKTALTEFADRLTAVHPMVAGELCDLLVARVGK